MIFIADNTTTATVDIQIPTVRPVVAPIKLSIVSENTKDSFELSATLVSSNSYSMKVSVEIASTLPKGQYAYNATDKTGSVSKGVLQIGSTDNHATEYQQTKTTKVYEG